MDCSCFSYFWIVTTHRSPAEGFGCALPMLFSMLPFLNFASSCFSFFRILVAPTSRVFPAAPSGSGLLVLFVSLDLGWFHLSLYWIGNTPASHPGPYNGIGPLLVVLLLVLNCGSSCFLPSFLVDHISGNFISFIFVFLCFLALLLLSFRVGLFLLPPNLIWDGPACFFSWIWTDPSALAPSTALAPFSASISGFGPRFRRPP